MCCRSVRCWRDVETRCSVAAVPLQSAWSRLKFAPHHPKTQLQYSGKNAGGVNRNEPVQGILKTQWGSTKHPTSKQRTETNIWLPVCLYPALILPLSEIPSLLIFSVTALSLISYCKQAVTSSPWMCRWAGLSTAGPPQLQNLAPSCAVWPDGLADGDTVCSHTRPLAAHHHSGRCTDPWVAVPSVLCVPEPAVDRPLNMRRLQTRLSPVDLHPDRDSLTRTDRSLTRRLPRKRGFTANEVLPNKFWKKCCCWMDYVDFLILHTVHRAPVFSASGDFNLL